MKPENSQRLMELHTSMAAIAERIARLWDLGCRLSIIVEALGSSAPHSIAQRKEIAIRIEDSIKAYRKIEEEYDRLRTKAKPDPVVAPCIRCEKRVEECKNVTISFSVQNLAASKCGGLMNVQICDQCSIELCHSENVLKFLVQKKEQK